VCAAQDLGIRWDGKELRVAAPELHLLSGRVLERLRNGAAVALNVQITLSDGIRILRRSRQRFIVSYDLWEERYSVTRASGKRAAISHLMQGAAEAWCLDQTVLATDAVPLDQPLRVRLEVKAEEPKQSGGAEADEGLSLTALIEAFSRPARAGEQSWAVDKGPFRLREVRQNGNDPGGK
jgi:hypothetical protein